MITEQHSGARRAMALACALGLLLLQATPARAQAPTDQPKPSDQSKSSDAADPRHKLDNSQTELRGLEDTLKASDARRHEIETEVASIRDDRAKLAAALIDTTDRAQKAEQRVGDVEKRLDTALASEAAIRTSLAARRDVVAEVLAALQRIGRKPPPAVLASPADILQAVRTSMLLGAVVPELRAETEALASDLSDLVRLREGVANERENLAREVASLGEERQRLTALIEARQNSLAQAQQSLDSERARAGDLAHQATDLKDLIARMEGEIADQAQTAEARRKLDANNAGDAAGGARVAMGPLRDPARLAPAISFADAKGTLRLPAAGAILKQFGAPDGFGGAEKGLSIGTRASAIVSAPVDGKVVYCGPWRTFGQLLIINAGDGYYIVLAGMERINVNLGQFVLAGEPVASMGDGSTKTAAAIAIGAAQPILYVEFRKDGSTIDPGPWWAKPDFEKARG